MKGINCGKGCQSTFFVFSGKWCSVEVGKVVET